MAGAEVPSLEGAREVNVAWPCKCLGSVWGFGSRISDGLQNGKVESRNVIRMDAKDHGMTDRYVHRICFFVQITKAEPGGTVAARDRHSTVAPCQSS